MRICDHVGASVYTSTDGKRKVCYRCGNDIDEPTIEMVDMPKFPPRPITSAEPGHHLARKSDPATSKAAAWMNPGRRNSQRYRLALAFYEHPEPMTWDHAYKAAGVQGASQRITELRDRGIIEIVGTDATSRGAAGQTYQLTTAGRAMMRP